MKSKKSPSAPSNDLLDGLLSQNDPTPLLTAVEPLPLFKDLVEVIRRHVILEPPYAVAVAFWVIQTYCYQLFSHAPLLIINAPERACGKSVLLSLIGRLVPRPLECTNITVAALFRVVQTRQPTLLIDEADTFLEGKVDLAGILNKGYEKGGVVLRTESIGDRFEAVGYEVYGPKALAGIALERHLPDATLSRGINVGMRRKIKGETVERLRNADAQVFAALRSRINRFVQDNSTLLAKGHEPMPEELSDREQDSWAPLFAVASCGGGEGLLIARDAALFAKSATQEPQSMSNNLLADIREVLEVHDSRYISTAELIELLKQDSEMGWDRYNRGFPLTARQLAKNLGSYGVHSKTVRIGIQTPKGYEVREFDEAFKRYLPTPEPTSAPLSDAEHEVVFVKIPPLNPPAPPGTVEGAEELF